MKNFLLIPMLLLTVACQETSPASQALDQQTPQTEESPELPSESFTCSEINGLISSSVTQMRKCSMDSDCTELKSTYGSCGCTNNLVVNQSADATNYKKYSQLLIDQCGIIGGPCNCPSADGVICQNNLCQWDYTPSP